MKKIFTPFAALLLSVAGVAAQENGQQFFYDHAAKVSSTSMAQTFSSNGKYLSGQEGQDNEGIVILWDTEANEYTIVNQDNIESQQRGVSNLGSVFGDHGGLPAFKALGADSWTNISENTGQIRGVNADESIFVGVTWDESYNCTPVIWKKNGETYEEIVLPLPDQNDPTYGTYFTAGAFAVNISDDSKIIAGQANDGPYSLILWRLNNAGEYVFENVADSIMNSEGSRWASIGMIEALSPNGKYVTGQCAHDYEMPEGEWSFDSYAYRYDTETKEIEWIPFPVGTEGERSARGFDVANDGTIVYSFNDSELNNREAYIVRSGSRTPVPFAEWLSYSNVEYPEQMSDKGVSLVSISGDAKKLGGSYVHTDGSVKSFFFHIPDLNTGVDEVTDNNVNNGNFCYVNGRVLYIPAGCDRLSIYNMAGLQVYTDADGAATSFNLASLPGGVYIVKAEKDGNIFVTKIAL